MSNYNTIDTYLITEGDNMASLKFTKYGYFPENLTSLRKDKQLTQIKLASLIGVTNKTVSDWENGIKEPREALFREVCDFFNVSPEQMCNFLYEPDKKTWIPKPASNNPGSASDLSTIKNLGKENESDTLDTTLQLCLLINKLSEDDKILFLQIGKKLFSHSSCNSSTVKSTSQQV